MPTRGHFACRFTAPIIGEMMPVYDGAVEPATWNNIAGPGLK